MPSKSTKPAVKPATVQKKTTDETPVKESVKQTKAKMPETAKKETPVKSVKKKEEASPESAIKDSISSPVLPTDKTAEKKTSTTDEKSAAVTEADPTNDKWAEIRQILNRMKTETIHEISRSIRNGSELKVGEEPTGDIYDQASSERDRELGLILNDREREKVHNIDDALMRMDEGEYGICEECDEEIPMGRLKVLPFTRHCVRCKSDLEKVQAQTKRFEEDRAYRDIPLGDDDEG